MLRSVTTGSKLVKWILDTQTAWRFEQPSRCLCIKERKLYEEGNKITIKRFGEQCKSKETGYCQLPYQHEICKTAQKIRNVNELL